MRRRPLLSLTAALLGSAALTPVTAFAAPTLPSCAALATFLKANTFITQTASDNQGLASPTATMVAQTATNAAYCAVHFQFSQLSGPTFGYAVGKSQTIGINITLPLNSTDGGVPTNPKGYSWTAVNGAWNGKIENIGGGGNQGSVSFEPSVSNAGYVGSNTDTGHNSAQNGTIGNFGVIQATHQLDVGKINDFIYEGIHQQYVWALALAKQYYGQAAIRNYWNGCSTGGRQGLELAGMFGSDFDGFVVGAPATYWQEFFSAYAWFELVNQDDVVGVGDAAVTNAQYVNASNNAIHECDVEGADTVQDGVIDDPRQCTYSAAADKTLLCPSAGGTGTSPTCMDLIQAHAVDKMWDGPRNHVGRRLWHTWGRPDQGFFVDVGPAQRTGQLSQQQSSAWNHKDLTFSPENLYSTRKLAAANPRGQPNPIALEDEYVLGNFPGGPEDLMRSSDYDGIITNVYNNCKNGAGNCKIIHWQGGSDTLIPWGTRSNTIGMPPPHSATTSAAAIQRRRTSAPPRAHPGVLECNPGGATTMPPALAIVASSVLEARSEPLRPAPKRPMDKGSFLTT